MALKEYNLFPPARGYKDSYILSNPLEFSAIEITGWRFHHNALVLTEDFINISVQTLDNSTHNKVITSYKGSSEDDIIYVNGNSLRYIPRLSGSETEVTASITSGDPPYRIAVVDFRNRKLFGTMTNGLWWYNPVAHTARKAGVAAPSGAITLAVGSATGLTGAYKAVYTYVNDQGHESNPAPASNTLTVANQKIDWSGITVGPTGTVSRRLYRTTAGGAVYLFHSTIGDNSTTVLTGDAKADADLGSEVSTLNDVPPTAIRQIVATGARVWLLDAANPTIWASRTDEVTLAPNWEAFPPSLSLDIPILGGQDSLMAGFVWGSRLFIASNRTIYEIIGDPATEAAVEKILDMGFASPYSWTITPEGVMFLNNVGKLVIWDGEDSVTKFPEGIDQITTALLGAGILDGPELVYDADKQLVYINVGQGPSSHASYIFHTTNGQFTNHNANILISHFNPFDRLYYVSATGDSTIRWNKGDGIYSPHVGLARSLEYSQFYPTLNQDVFISKLKLLVRAGTFIGSMAPIILIRYWLNGSRHGHTKYLNTSIENLGTEPSVPATRILEVPVHRIARSISFSISFPQATAVTNGLEIYRIWLEADEEPIGRSKDSDRRARNDGGLVAPEL